MFNNIYIFYVFSSIIILGVSISWISTYFATQKLLNLNTEKLYN